MLPGSRRVVKCSFVYECGGCGTILQAKKRKNDTKDTGLHKLETHTVQKIELEHVSEDKEAQSASQEETLSSTDLPPDKTSGRDQNETMDSNMELSRGVTVQKNELERVSENKEAQSSSQEETLSSSELTPEKNSGKDQNANTDSNMELSRGVTMQKNGLKRVSADKEAQSASQEETLSSTDLPPDKNSGRDQNETTDSNMELSRGVTVQKNELEHVSEDKEAQSSSQEETLSSSELTPEKNSGRDQNANTDSNMELSQGVTVQKNGLERVFEDKEAQSVSQEETLSFTDLPPDKNSGRDQNETTDSNMELSRGVTVQKNELERVSKDKEAQSSSQEETLSSSELTPEKNSGRDQNANMDSNMELFRGVTVQKNGLERVSEDKEAQSASQEETLSSTDLPPDKNSGRDQNETTDSNMELSQDVTVQKNELERVSEDKEAQSSSQEETLSSSELTPEKNSGRDQNANTDSNMELSRGVTVQKNELERVSEDREAQSASQEETLSSSELPPEKNSGMDQNETMDSTRALSQAACSKETEVDQDNCSSEEKDGGDQNEYQHCNIKQSGDVNFPDEVSSSTELHHPEIEESSPVAGTHSEGYGNGKYLEQEDGTNQNEYVYCNGMRPRGVNFSNEVAPSTELNHLERVESSPIAGAHCEGDENGKCLEQEDGRNQNEYGYCNGEQSGGENFTQEVASSSEYETDSLKKNELEHVSEDREAQSSSKEEPISSTDLPLDKNSGKGQNEESSPAAMAGIEVDQDVCSDEVASSTALHHLEIASSSPVMGDHSEGDENGKCLEQDDGKQPGGVTFYEEVTSNEPRHFEIDVSSLTVARAYSEGDENGKCMEQDDCNGMLSGGETLTEEVASSNELHRLESEVSLLVVGAYSEGDENGKCLEQDDCSGKQSDGENFTEEVASSKELRRFEIEESSLVTGAHSEVLEIRNRLEEDNERYQNEHGCCNGNQSGVKWMKLRIVLEQDNENNQTSSPLIAGAPSEVHEIRNCSEEDNERYQHEHRSCNANQSGGENFTEEDASSAETNHLKSKESSPVAGAHRDVHEIRNCLEEDNEKYQNEHGSCNGNQSEGETAELNYLETESSPPVTGAHSEAHDITTCFEKNNRRKQSEFEDHEREWPGNTKFSNEVPSSTELTCPEIEESSHDADDNIKRRIFGSSRVENLLAARPKDLIITAQRPSGESIFTENRMSLHSEQREQSQKRGLDDFESFNRVSSSEFSVTLRDKHKSPTTRSNYAYDGSVSSYNGTDNQVPDQYRHLCRRNLKAAVSSSTKAIPRRNEVTNTIGKKKQYYTRGGKWHEDENLEPTRHGHTARMRFESGECQSRVPFYSRGGYEKGGPSNYDRKQFRSPNKPKKPREENLELLKMVFELQDQLNRTRISKRNGNGRFPGTEKQIPSNYDRVAPEVEICPNLSYTRCPRRCNQGKIRPHQSRTSCIPFTSQVDCSCVHCIPQDWHSSAPLPPHIFYNESQYPAHPCQRRYNLHHYSPSGPHHYRSSEFSSQSCGENSGDPWHKAHEAKKYPREQNYVKNHVRPVASGAPFLVCYRCSELLKLPEDFLLFRRKCHKLKCSACLVILKFSLQNRSRVVRYTDYTPDAIAPPPSEVDDYGPSLCKSSEGEPFSVELPIHARKRDSNGKKMSSGSSFEPVEEREKQRLIFKESQNKHKSPVETNVSAGVSPKMSKAKKPPSEIEELPSPLHMLMGYTSPSDVMRT
ncbi:hypothetical protein Acr_02g0002740 [Actinidia rufa]|uniref:Probable zinc-ribbon domain-containing protein n=1 Tax=Actinidia rufa TaxID=165716 RepID=A0A7J0E6A8_9ERIC|nr:hypothetical protein Acr_02g0002740 [Actinidia rufa]